MKIKMKTLMASPRGIFSSGSVIFIDDETAKQLINGNFAELIEDLNKNESHQLSNKLQESQAKQENSKSLDVLTEPKKKGKGKVKGDGKDTNTKSRK